MYQEDPVVTTEPIRLLIVEDTPLDAELLIDWLRADGFVLEHQRVDTAEDVRAALHADRWDCVISDFSLPTLRAPDVLALIHETHPDLPCIVASGTIGEEAAVEVLRAGAADFFPKGQLARLGPAIRRELREAEQRRQRRVAEAALRESERSFRALFASNPVPMYVFAIDTLQFLEVNAAAIDRYGYSRDEFLALHATDIRTADEAERFRTMLGGLTSPLSHGGTWRHRLKSGQQIHVEITTHSLEFAGRHALLVAAVDCTARVEATRALMETEERMRFALEASRVGIWEADLMNGGSRWSSICEGLHGLEPGTFGGTLDAFAASIHPEDRERTFQEIERSTRQGTDAHLLYRTVWPDGRIRWISGTGRSFYNEQNVPLRAAGVSLDVTEQRALEAQYRQSQKMEAIGQLAGGVAHDFNNLLTAIIGYGNLLLERVGNDDANHADIHEIVRAGESAATLTRQLLAFGRRQLMQPRVTTVNAIVTDVERLLTRLIGENVKLVSRLEPSLKAVRVDPGQLEQVLVNLAVNARDAMPEGGTLTIETTNVELDAAFQSGHLSSASGDYVRISVTDTGAGMSADVQARLFEPFFTTKAPGKGTGLGLATVYGIVQQSHGQIYVYSELGRGSVFKIYLPVTADEVVPVVETSGTPCVGGSETVLVVEDNDGARRLARVVLTRQGYQVIDAASAELALELLNPGDLHVDLVMTDIIMTGITGIALAQRLRISHPELRVLFTSGYSNDVAFHDEERHPDMRFLEKPYTPARLARAVREALDTPSHSGERRRVA